MAQRNGGHVGATRRTESGVSADFTLYFERAQAGRSTEAHVRWLPMAMALFGLGVELAQAAPVTTRWVCEVVYAPQRQVWPREVRLTYDDRQLLQVDIDGAPVFRFSVAGTWVMTSLDNERVRIDVASRTWNSDFRGRAQGQGRCDEAPN